MAGQRATSSWSVLAVVGAAGLAGVLNWTLRPPPIQPPPGTPATHQSGGYIGSAGCQSCHPGAHASWSATYHSTMTRPASALVDGSTDRIPKFPVELTLDGVRYRLFEWQGQIEMEGPDLDAIGKALATIAALSDASWSYKQKQSRKAFENAPKVRRRVALLTGSHHYLALFIDSGEHRPLRQFPFVYFFDEQRFIPRREAFLQPPDALPVVARFNANCIQCHTVAGRPRQTEGVDAMTGRFWEKYDSDLADLSIACEACHGPGAAHVDTYENPLARISRSSQPNEKASKIFVPRPSDPKRASAACGQCHSYFLPNDPQSWWEEGFSNNFRAGSSLDASRTIVDSQKPLENIGAHESQLFWADGSIRVGGREYNGMTASACYERGVGESQVSCVSCHSMHEGGRDKQIRPEFAGVRQDEMCIQCHQVGDGHSRHGEDSPGSRCVTCHMPKTSYALLSGIRSHRIQSPRLIPAQQSTGQPPLACALCHTDREKSWLDENLKAFLADEPWVSPESDGSLPWALQLALRGNAAERAIMVSALASEEALMTAGRTPFDRVKSTLIEDDYPAVRHMARRAANRLAQDDASLPSPSSSVKLSPITTEQIQALKNERDLQPITISE